MEADRTNQLLRLWGDKRDLPTLARELLDAPAPPRRGQVPQLTAQQTVAAQDAWDSP